VEEQLRRLVWIADAAVVVLDESAAQLGAVVVPSTAGAAVLAEIGAFRFGRRLRRALTETQDSQACRAGGVLSMRCHPTRSASAARATSFAFSGGSD